jgi:arginyl-tRNA synthetase
MKENFQELLSQIIKNSLKELRLKDTYDEELYLDFPSDNRFGDLSSNIALRLSKIIGKPPFEIAVNIAIEIKKLLGKSTLKDYISEVKAEGAGFVNFYLSDKYFYEQLKEVLIGKESFLKADVGRGKNVLLEFVSANPTGPLSVAHARQAVVGDALANILKFLGFKAQKEFYLNDEGNQINILGESVELRLKELEGKNLEFPDNYYQGDYIYDIAIKIKAEKRENLNLGEYAADYILDIIKEELDDFGVKFDSWYSQKELRKSGKIDVALDCLKKKKFLYEQDGALWFKSSDFNDDKDRVVIKSDGSYTYLAPDIAYHEDKYKRGFEWLINLWGPDHHGYINRLKASVEAFGHSADSISIIIVQLATIFRQGKPIQMSTRRGQYITLREVLNEVGRDAARFFFLMRRTSSHLDFDLDIAKKQTSENPVYYVQYAYARICSILRSSNLEIEKDIDLSVLKEKQELELIKKLSQLSYILAICLGTQDPYMLTIYLQDLSETFHKFYDQHRVLGQDDALTKARLALIEATKTIIATGLDLLGISKPEKM